MNVKDKILSHLPTSIKNILNNCSIIEYPKGLSGADLYVFKDECNTYYLKAVEINNKFTDELEDEYKNYKWLKDKIPSPKVICFEKTNTHHYLLRYGIQGITLDKIFSKGYEIRDFIALYAEALKTIHSINTDNCPVDQRDDKLLATVKHYIKFGIDVDDFEEENKGMNPQDLYHKLISLKPKNNDLVYIHGDYCPDNLLFDGMDFKGIIDAGRSGIGDRYKDIALAVRNIKNYYGEDWLDLFFNTYGIDSPDWDKIEFYIILDEFY